MLHPVCYILSCELFTFNLLISDIVEREKKIVENFEFDPVKMTPYGTCTSIWKMINLWLVLDFLKTLTRRPFRWQKFSSRSNFLLTYSSLSYYASVYYEVGSVTFCCFVYIIQYLFTGSTLHLKGVMLLHQFQQFLVSPIVLVVPRDSCSLQFRISEMKTKFLVYLPACTSIKRNVLGVGVLHRLKEQKLQPTEMFALIKNCFLIICFKLYTKIFRIWNIQKF